MMKKQFKNFRKFLQKFLKNMKKYKLKYHKQLFDFFHYSHSFILYKKGIQCILPTLCIGLFLITEFPVPQVEAEKKYDNIVIVSLPNERFLEKKKRLLEGRTKTILSFNQNSHISNNENDEDETKVNIILTNDQEYLKKYGSRAYRNNNPGNLKYTGQIGAIGKDDKNFAIFENYEAGRLAHMRQITLDAKRGKTLGSFIKRFAPHTENHTSTYEKEILESFGGYASDTPLSSFELEKLQRIMQQIEGWREPIAQQIVKADTVAVIQNLDTNVQKNSKNSCFKINTMRERILCIRHQS